MLAIVTWVNLAIVVILAVITVGFSERLREIQYVQFKVITSQNQLILEQREELNRFRKNCPTGGEKL